MLNADLLRPDSCVGLFAVTVDVFHGARAIEVVTDYRERAHTE